MVMSPEEQQEMAEALYMTMDSFAEAISNNIDDEQLVMTILEEAGLIIAERSLKAIIAKGEALRAQKNNQRLPGTKDFDPRISDDLL